MDTLERIVQLRQAGVRFAVATVVSRQAPVSSQLGDKAIILEDGTLEGFIGGACSREIIRKQARDVLESESPRLVRISPDPQPSVSNRHDEICVPMTCASEGALDVYIEPQIDKKHLLVVGGSPIAVALAKQGRLQGYEVTLVCEADELPAVKFGLGGLTLDILDLKQLADYLKNLSASRKGALEAVVASMGHYDEEALQQLLAITPRYLGLVSSRKRGETIRTLLRDMGTPETSLKLLRNPVGLDIGAKTPNEVAVSIIAEMIQLRRLAAKAASTVTRQVAEAIDPVCGMTVDIAQAKFSAELDGTTYYFCCPNCRHHFLKNPTKYLEAIVS